MYASFTTGPPAAGECCQDGADCGVEVWHLQLNSLMDELYERSRGGRLKGREEEMGLYVSLMRLDE